MTINFERVRFKVRVCFRAKPHRYLNLNLRLHLLSPPQSLLHERLRTTIFPLLSSQFLFYFYLYQLCAWHQSLSSKPRNFKLWLGWRQRIWVFHKFALLPQLLLPTNDRICHQLNTNVSSFWFPLRCRKQLVCVDYRAECPQFSYGYGWCCLL